MNFSDPVSSFRCSCDPCPARTTRFFQRIHLQGDPPIFYSLCPKHIDSNWLVLRPILGTDVLEMSFDEFLVRFVLSA
jgi:hypothetical protein